MNSMRHRQFRIIFIILFVTALSPVAAKDPIDYFLPTPIYDRLETMQGNKPLWGASNVIPREMHNGLEDTTNKFCYWDGKILKSKDGKYHMFASRWSESQGHNGWFGSIAIHAVSDKPTGPYVDKGPIWPNNQGGKGHNVTADILPDGTWVVLVSETRPGDIFTSNSPDGPWTYKGQVTIDANGYNDDMWRSNMSMCVRTDGSILMIARRGQLMLSTNGIMGPYKVLGPSIYPQIGLNNWNAEDPAIWYSGGKYHVTVNWWDARKAYHLVSTDGIHNWTNNGLIYDPKKNFVRYTDGTVNYWNKIERPGVLIEDGIVTHFTFAVLDVEKGQELGNDTHGSKIIVVPFDGASFDGVTTTHFKRTQTGTQTLALSIKNSSIIQKKTFSIPAEIANSNSSIKIMLHDMTGSLVTSKYYGPANNEINYTLNRSIVSSGAYCITLQYGKQNFTDRLIVP